MQVIYSVTAVASDGRWNTIINFSVRILEVQDIVVVYVKNAVLEDVENILSKMQSSISSYWIGSLSAAVISDNEAILGSSISKIANKDSGEIKTLLKILVYGFDVNHNLNIHATQLKRYNFFYRDPRFQFLIYCV